MTSHAGTEIRTYRRLDHYRLLCCLGVGGMGEVWAARDLAAPGTRIVAVKITTQEGVEAAKVLWDEARIASLIHHPNVCSVHELGQAGGLQYLVMDWCDGATLHDLLQSIPNQTLSLPLAAKMAAQVAAGLHAAHELVDESGEVLGVVHRDVSPQNVLITSQGTILVADFGVAKAAGQAHRPTETGEVKGKLSYMAPEQVKSKDVDRRADVFALGCLLYFATVGRRPFRGDDALATLYQLLEKDVERPCAIDPSYPEALEAVVMKALAKDREERFQTAEEFQVALERWLVESGTRVSEKEIARVLDEHLGEMIRQRKALIAERVWQAETMSEDDEDTAPLPVGDRDGAGSSRDSSSASTAVVTGTAPRTPTLLSNVSRIRPRALWAGLATLAGLAVAAVVLSRTVPGGDSLGASPTEMAPRPVETTSNTAEESKTAPDGRLVTVRVTVHPAGASILLDGTEVGLGSYEAELEPRSEAKVIEARLEGHRSISRRLVFDRSQDVHLELVPEGPSAGARPSAEPGARKSPKGGVSQVQPPPQPPPTPRLQQKKPRPIDATNPFESPE